MNFKEKDTQENQDPLNKKAAKEQGTQYNQKAGSRTSEAGESEDLKSSKKEDINTFEEQDDDDIY